MFQNPLDQSEYRILWITIPHKLFDAWTLAHEFFYIVKHLQKQQICSVILSGYGQACQRMAKVTRNGESAEISREFI